MLRSRPREEFVLSTKVGRLLVGELRVVEKLVTPGGGAG